MRGLSPAGASRLVGDLPLQSNDPAQYAASEPGLLHPRRQPAEPVAVGAMAGAADFAEPARGRQRSLRQDVDEVSQLGGGGETQHHVAYFHAQHGIALAGDLPRRRGEEGVGMQPVLAVLFDVHPVGHRRQPPVAVVLEPVFQGHGAPPVGRTMIGIRGQKTGGGRQ